MLSEAENERLTRVGPGTPMGALLRRYWLPVAGLDEMKDRWTKRVRILGEDLVLFKDRRGEFGLIAEACPHRRASLAYGIPTSEGIRCPYHGWAFDGTGQCVEQPNEPAESNFKDKIQTAAYPVQGLGGMLFAYLGPLPAPLIPRYDGLVVEPAIRMWGETAIDCNWLHIMENSADPVHTEWLHGKLTEFRHEKENLRVGMSRHHLRIGFDEFEHGLIKRRIAEGQTEDAPDWQIGHPLVFPNILGVSVGYTVPGGIWDCYELQFRVPIDDEHTQHFWLNAYHGPAHWQIPAEMLDHVPSYHVRAKNDAGEFLLDLVHGQDVMAWESQGKIAQRGKEHLASHDRGVTLYRKMLLREIERMEAGHDPMAIVRDPKANEFIDLPFERDKDTNADGFAHFVWLNQVSFSPFAQQLLDVFTQNIAKTPVSA